MYELIWKRAVASQMKDATGTRISVQIQIGRATFRASGKSISFAGFLRAYVEGSDDPDADLADQEKILPGLKEGDSPTLLNLKDLEHTTSSPARYTEGSLIKRLEELGIGRPSTWATIVDVVLSRDYAFKRGQQLIPSFLAMAVIGLMERYFQRVIDYEYTASLEEDLDAISRGEADNLEYLQNFYAGDRPGLDALVRNGEATIDPRDVCGIPIARLSDDRYLEVRIGRYGAFLSDGTHRASIPEGVAPDELTSEKAEELLRTSAQGPESLGSHPVSGKPIYLKTGRFGPYIQEGDIVEGEAKPKMASLLPGMTLETMTFDTAVKLLSLPKTLGVVPETGVEVIASNGRFGPYVKAGTETRSIPVDMLLLDITLEEALHLLAQPKSRGRQRAAPQALKELGPHPDTGKVISVKSGRYGPYVTDGEINASLPKAASVEEFALGDAVTLLAERAAKIAADGGVKKGRTTKTKTKSAPKATKAKESEKKPSKSKNPKKKS
jgi:DNA topoisomerase-1